eukprot:1554707-Prymnesium_polylepis.1
MEVFNERTASTELCLYSGFISDSVGFGLFNRTAIPSGTIVCAQAKPLRLSSKAWSLRQLSLKLPDDAGILARGRVYADDAFADPARPPLWYLLNHSSSPNLHAKLSRGRVVWVALRPIPPHTLLTFHYGEPDPAWGDL